MAEYIATVEWRSDGGFQDGSYSRAHHLGSLPLTSTITCGA